MATSQALRDRSRVKGNKNKKWKTYFDERLECRPAPFQSPGMGLGLKETRAPKTSATRLVQRVSTFRGTREQTLPTKPAFGFLGGHLQMHVGETYWRRKRASHSWSPMAMPSTGPTWNSHCAGMTSALVPEMLMPAYRLRRVSRCSTWRIQDPGDTNPRWSF